jgi:hypothetical protein
VTFFDGDGAGTLGAERWVLTAARTAVAGVSSWQDHAGPLGTYGCIEHYARVSPPRSPANVA